MFECVMFICSNIGPVSWVKGEVDPVLSDRFPPLPTICLFPEKDAWALMCNLAQDMICKTTNKRQRAEYLPSAWNDCCFVVCIHLWANKLTLVESADFSGGVQCVFPESRRNSGGHPTHTSAHQTHLVGRVFWLISTQSSQTERETVSAEVCVQTCCVCVLIYLWSHPCPPTPLPQAEFWWGQKLGQV